MVDINKIKVGNLIRVLDCEYPRSHNLVGKISRISYILGEYLFARFLDRQMEGNFLYDEIELCGYCPEYLKQL